MSGFDLHKCIRDNVDPALVRNQLKRIKIQNPAELRRQLQKRDATDDCPLDVAARYGRNELAEILLELGADRRAKMLDGCLAVHIAADFDHVELLKTLLKSDEGAVGILDNGGWSPLLHALCNGSYDAFMYIMETYKPACFTYTNRLTFGKRGHTTHPLYYAALLPLGSAESEWNNRRIIRELLNNGCGTDCEGEHLVVWAARAGNLGAVKNLVEHTEPSKRDIAIARDHTEVARLSIDHKDPFRNDIRNAYNQILSYLSRAEKKAK